MEFDWCDAKDEVTHRERGFGFAFAVGIFAGQVMEIEDSCRDYGETRIKAIGEVDDLVLAVVYTDRDGVRNIISACRANRKERGLWHG